jgi:hypothetical protein
LILIAKIKKVIFESNGYHVLAGNCGAPVVLIYRGGSPPKPLKTVDYQFNGEYIKTKYGKSFEISEYKKAGNIKVHRPSRAVTA